MEVKILSRKFIAPSSPAPPHLQNHKLSCFDQIVPAFPVNCIFFYPAVEEKHHINNAERSEQLQKSLSETLTLFYPLGGRFIKDDPLVDCNDKGAEYLEAHVSGCLSQHLREGDHTKQLQNNSHLLPIPSRTDNDPIVLVQFNRFECGGVAIGTCILHRIADAFTSFTFLNSWAVASRIGIDKVDCPSFQLASFCPPKDICISALTENIMQMMRNRVVYKRFVFNGEAISNLKAIASSSQMLKHQPTRLEVVTALIWKALIKASQARHGCLRPSLLGLSVNLRGRTMLPIPKNSCGNFIGPAIAKFMPRDDDSNVHLHDLVGLFHDAIKSSITNYAKASNGDELFLTVVDSSKNMYESFGKSEIDVYNFTSWNKFPAYEVDFGWGKPAWVTSPPIIKADNFGLLLDTKDGDGIEACLSLEENNMLLFQQNLDITSFREQKVQV